MKHWHKEAKGADKYLKWKVQFALSIYTTSELLNGVKHISSYPMKYPIEEVLAKINQ